MPVARLPLSSVGAYLERMSNSVIARPTGQTLTAPRPRWLVSEAADPAVVRRLATELRLPPMACELLARRGLGEPMVAREYLRPHAGQIHDPVLLADIGAGVERLARAHRAGERVLVHGDYDVDGICSTAMLVRALGMMGVHAIPFIPDRLGDGYDLTDAGIDAARAAGATLIVTVDCGIVAHRAVTRAAAAGIDVIVTDHHTPGPDLPDAVAVINPNRSDSAYPDRGLAGAGVAYKLLVALAGALGYPADRLTSFLDLVALATIADLAPLAGENRALVRWGLAIIARSPNVGLRALIAACNLRPEEITAGQVGFVLAPRLNAAGRLGSAMRGVRLLLTDDRAEAEVIAGELEIENRRRRDLDEEALAEALEILEREYVPERDYGVVLASGGWHPGVIGIVASRVVERIHRPTILIALGAGEGKGSGRSIPGFHLQEALVECSEHLERFGGHRAAAGCSIDPARVDDFRAAFQAHARATLTREQLVPQLRVDAELRLDQATPDLERVLRHFAPFGIGNPGPLFASYGVRLAAEPRIVGSNHLKLTLAGDGARLEAIGFGMAEHRETCLSGPIDVAFRLEENRWTTRSGAVRTTLQARLVDLRSAA